MTIIRRRLVTLESCAYEICNSRLYEKTAQGLGLSPKRRRPTGFGDGLEDQGVFVIFYSDFTAFF